MNSSTISPPWQVQYDQANLFHRSMKKLDLSADELLSAVLIQLGNETDTKNMFCRLYTQLIWLVKGNSLEHASYNHDFYEYGVYPFQVFNSGIYKNQKNATTEDFFKKHLTKAVSELEVEGFEEYMRKRSE